MEYDNTNKGVLFRNDDHTEENNQPHYRGRLNVDGTDLWLSAWIKTSKNGVKYMSLSVQVKDAAQSRKKPGGGSAARDDLNDSIPFAPEVR
jgi:hypothetical protein